MRALLDRYADATALGEISTAEDSLGHHAEYVHRQRGCTWATASSC
jgi:hypothetical protein